MNIIAEDIVTELKDSKSKLQQWWESHKFTVGLLLGFLLATVICYNIYTWRMTEAKEQKTLIFNKTVYSFTVRDVQ